jgi:hypothetical protein
MRAISILAMLFLTCIHLFAISIEDAYKKGFITYEIKGTDAGHSGSCISVSIVNNSPTIINLEIETGRVFEPADTFVQNMIVTKRFFTRLNPKQKTTQRLFAMCAESGDASPNESRSFSHGKMAQGLLLSMSKYIEANNMQNSEGQSLIWHVSNGNNVFNECRYSPVMYASLKKYFAAEKSAVFTPCSESSGSDVAPTPRVIRTFHVSFGFSVPQTSAVEISVFDADGNKVKELDVIKSMEPDWYDYESSFTNSGLTKGATYEVRLIINGKPKRVMYIENP